MTKSIREVLEELFNRGYHHGLGGGRTNDGETYAVDDTISSLLALIENRDKSLIGTLERIGIPLQPDVIGENKYDAWGRQELINIINTKAEMARECLSEIRKEMGI